MWYGGLKVLLNSQERVSYTLLGKLWCRKRTRFSKSIVNNRAGMNKSQPRTQEGKR
jgi:hypothetical protein